MQIATTYSIVAHEPSTGRIGAAVQSHWFNVADVLWVRAGVGAVATQSLASFGYGPRILGRLEDGGDPTIVLPELLADDPDREVRQISVLTPRAATIHTGTRCIVHAGHRQGPDYCVAANLMARPTVWDAMAETFESTDGVLSERLMAALEAGQAEGGDIRGMQSCALVVMTGEPTGESWKDKVVDIRVDDHPEPLRELRRSLDVARAYDHMVEGEVLLGQRRLEEALEAHLRALELAPDRAEIAFWTAVSHVAIGDVDRALDLFRRCFAHEGGWRELVDRLVEPGLMPDDSELLDRIRRLRVT
ncbi:MAG TPA: DUF1028 domain-containing protein [Candidatus Krumholzibacteria bacterium]|nr:DUF1028 domain-containing protein [Candidatus Krumholzibacteria bacterium]